MEFKKEALAEEELEQVDGGIALESAKTAAGGFIFESTKSAASNAALAGTAALASGAGLASNGALAGSAALAGGLTSRAAGMEPDSGSTKKRRGLEAKDILDSDPKRSGF